MGSSSVTGDEVILFADNMSFDGTDRGGKMTLNGQLFIGHTASDRPNNGGHVKLGSITSPGGTVTIGYSSPNITLDLTGGGAAVEHLTGDTGGQLNPTANNFNIIGGTVVAGTSPLKVAGVGSTLTINSQRSQALAATDATKIGLSNFNSAQFTVDANGFVSATGTIPITTTENSGTATPSAGNLNIFGPNNALTGYSPWTVGSGATATINMPGTVKWVVNATANLGTHTTIQAAVTAASSGDDVFITPGTYTENLTLKAGVNLVAYDADALTPNVTIVGNSTLSTAGAVSISGIRLQTNSAAFLTVSGSVASVAILKNCYLNCSNSTGISYTSSSATSTVQIVNCTGNLGTTGIGLYTMSSIGQLNILWSSIANSGSSTTASSNSAGLVQFVNANLNIPISSTSTGAVNFFGGGTIDTKAMNTTCLTAGGTGGGTSYGMAFLSGSASAISIGTGVAYTGNLNTVSSTNTNAITGAGSISIGGYLFSNTSSTVNTTTQTLPVFYAGQYKGRTVSTAPSAGMIGEQIRATLAQGSAISLVTMTDKTVTSISLTAGIWDVTGIVNYLPNASTSVTQAYGSISTVNNTISSNSGDDYVSLFIAATVGFGPSMIVPALRVSLAATTTYYLIARSDFTVSTQTAFGRISATRVS